MNLSIKSYSTALDVFVSQNCPAYAGDSTALYGLDPSGGGRNIPVGTTYAVYDSYFYTTTPLNTFSFTLLERYATGALEVTGTTTPTGLAFTVGNSFSIIATEAGTTVTNTGTVTIGGTGTVADFIAAVSAAAVPFVSASVNTAGNIVFTHSQGGSIAAINVVGTPLTAAGFDLTTPKVRQNSSNASVTQSLLLHAKFLSS